MSRVTDTLFSFFFCDFLLQKEKKNEKQTQPKNTVDRHFTDFALSLTLQFFFFCICAFDLLEKRKYWGTFSLSEFTEGLKRMAFKETIGEMRKKTFKRYFFFSFHHFTALIKKTR